LDVLFLRTPMKKIKDTIALLWRQATVWRRIVYAALICTLLAIILWLSKSTLPPINPPPPPVLCPPKFQNLMTHYQAVKDIPEKGRKCDELAKNVKNVDQCLHASQKEQDIYTEAKKCKVDNIPESDRHLDDLRARYDAYQSNPGTAEENAFLKACQAITPFDRSRPLSRDDRDILEECRRLSLEVTESYQRIQQLEQTYNALQTASSAVNEEQLIDTALLIVPKDERRMTNQQKHYLEKARVLANQREQCLTLLQTLQSKLQAARSNTAASIRLRLIEALNDLDALKPKSGYDCIGQRATPEMQQDIEQARELVRSSSILMLKKETDKLDFCAPPDIPLYDRIRNLRQALGQIDNSTLNPDQQKSLAKADRVIAALDDSDRRLQNLQEIAKAWARNPRNAVDRVKATYRNITDLDKQRFDDSHQQAWEIITTANDILTSRNPKKVPMYVEVEEANQKASDIKRRFEEQLKLKDIKVADDKSKTGLIIKIKGLMGKPDGWNYQRVYLVLTVTWYLTGDEFYSAESNETINTSFSQQYTYQLLINDVFEAFFNELERASQKQADETSVAEPKTTPQTECTE